jgi:membrane protease YdiL (CAAX protease family)
LARLPRAKVETALQIADLAAKREAAAPGAAGMIAPMDSRKSVAIELIAIAIAAAAFLATFQARAPYVDLVLAAATVALIVASTGRSRRLWLGIAGEPGQGRRALLPTAIFTVAALAGLAAVGATGALAEEESAGALQRFANWHIAVAALLYFPWALLQQFIFQLYLLGRLLQLLPVSFAVAITAMGFASVHFPRWPVMVVTLLSGAVWSLLYFRYRALLPLAASHALLGSALHYWVFGRDLLRAWLP